LPVEAYDSEILRRRAGLTHQRTSGFGIKRSRDIVQPAQFEDREFVLESGEHLFGNLLRPIDRLTRYEAWELQQAVMPDFDVDQHGVDAVERRPAIQTERQHVSSEPGSRFRMPFPPWPGLSQPSTRLRFVQTEGSSVA